MKKYIYPALLMPILVVVAFFFLKGDSFRWGQDLLVLLPPVVSMTAGVFVRKPSAWLYGFAMLVPYLWVGICSIAGLMPLTTIITFMTLPVAIACAQTMKKVVDGGTHLLSDLGERTSRLVMMFAVLLAVAFVAAKFI